MQSFIYYFYLVPCNSNEKNIYFFCLNAKKILFTASYILLIYLFFNKYFINIQIFKKKTWMKLSNNLFLLKPTNVRKAFVLYT